MKNLERMIYLVIIVTLGALLFWSRVCIFLP